MAIFAKKTLKTSKLLIKSSFFLGLMGVAAASNAQNAQSESYAISNLVGGYGVEQLTDTPFSLFCNATACPDSPYNQAINVIFGALAPSPFSSSVMGPSNPDEQKEIKERTGGNSYTDQAIYELLTTTVDQATSNMTQNLDAVKVPLPVPPEIASTLVFSNTEPASESETTTLPLNPDTLLNPVQYDDKQSAYALNFIRFLGGLISPTPIIDFSKIDTTELQSQLKNVLVQRYLITLRTLVAINAVGISNLYQIYSERMPVDLQALISKQNLQLPSDVQLPETLTPNASQLAFDQYMATRRFSEKWQKFIDGTDENSKATPAELQRQTIYLLREIHHELYKSRLNQERLLLTMSALQIQSSANMVFALNTLQRELCNEEVFKNACPPPPPTGAPEGDVSGGGAPEESGV